MQPMIDIVCSITGNASIYRNCAHFGMVDGRPSVVELSKSVSTNQTALRAIFAKMIGIRNFTTFMKSNHIETEKLNHSGTVTVVQKNSSLCHQISRFFLDAVTCYEIMFYSRKMWTYL